MKRQFIKFNPSQNLANQPSQEALSDQGAPSYGQVPGNVPHGIPVAPQFSQETPGMGGAFPPHWNGGGSQFGPQQAAAQQRPMTGPVAGNGQFFPAQQASPYETILDQPLNYRQGGNGLGQPGLSQQMPGGMPLMAGGPMIAPSTSNAPQVPGSGPLLMPGANFQQMVANPVSMPGGPPQTPGWGALAGPPQQPPFLPPNGPGSGKGGKKGPAKKRRVPIWARVALGVLAALVVIGIGLYSYYLYAFNGAVSTITDQQVTRLKGDAGSNPSVDNGNTSVLSGGRFNVLLLGSDTDEKFAGHPLAQTDIVITIDPASKSIGMLSIPRDFWLPLATGGMGKLDEAYAGGPAASMATIHQVFGIPIDFYAWVGLDGFIKVIDTVNGVDIDVQHPIVDGTYPDDLRAIGGDIHAYKRLYIEPGPQHLSGTQALEYVRSRHADLLGDFGRSVRQQQVLTQLKGKLSSPAIVGKLQEIANDLKGFVKTNMGLTQIIELANFARGIDMNKIPKVTLGPPYSYASTVKRDGQDVSIVVPICGPIIPKIAEMFHLGNKASCNIGTAPGTTTVASVPATPLALQTQSIASPFQTAGQLTSAGSQSLQGHGGDNLFGFRSILDLMFMITCESPEGIKV